MSSILRGVSPPRLSSSAGISPIFLGPAGGWGFFAGCGASRCFIGGGATGSMGRAGGRRSFGRREPALGRLPPRSRTRVWGMVGTTGCRGASGAGGDGGGGGVSARAGGAVSAGRVGVAGGGVGGCSGRGLAGGSGGLAAAGGDAPFSGGVTGGRDGADRKSVV